MLVVEYKNFTLKDLLVYCYDGSARLIILQGKEMEPITLLYEAGAILIIALACLVIRFKPPWTYKYHWSRG